MQAAQGSLGRVFVLRLEDGDTLPTCVEEFASANNIEGGLVTLVGGINNGTLVVGPEDGRAETLTPMHTVFDSVHEAAALGTLFKDSQGHPRMHMHAALGRADDTRVGCIREGIDVWKVAEVVIIEITGTGMSRKMDPSLGLELLST